MKSKILVTGRTLRSAVVGRWNNRWIETFPIPTQTDDRKHVYVSVGHQQMMTDAIKPLGLSMLQLVSARPRAEAGGRLFVDVTDILDSPGRDGLLNTLGRSDPLIRDALETLLARDSPGSLPAGPDAETPQSEPGTGIEWPDDSFASTIDRLIKQARAAITRARATLTGLHGEELIAAIATDIAALRHSIFEPRSMQVIMAAIDSTTWLIDQLDEWLGEPGAVDALSQSVPRNITAAMGLELLDLADVIRPHHDVVRLLRNVDGADVLGELEAVDGGAGCRSAISAYLRKHGMRCTGEIDITRPRWREQPSALIPMLLANIDSFEPGEAARRHRQGLDAARAKQADVLERLRSLPNGDVKATETLRMIQGMRTVVGYREFPKYSWMCRYDVYKQALVDEAHRLVEAGSLDHYDDIFFLRFEELPDVARSGHVDRSLIGRRRAEFATYERLAPPRVLTSDGEALSGSYHRDDVPSGVLVGLAVSSGVVEGRARVVHDILDAELEPGDILVTAHTDPSWTPLFLTIAGLVTEVGGLMTHGAVVAREYGLPAVVGVQQATTVIQDGQRIRLDGTNGHVTLL